MAQVTKRIAAARGYMAITVRNRGAIGRDRKKAHNEAAKQSWERTGVYFHANLRDKRFTPEHAREAGYAKRRGENVPRSSPQFLKMYYGRKYKSPRLGGGPLRADPLVKSGESKRNAKTAKVSSTSKGGRITYPGLRKFNFRHPQSKVRMNEEFRRITLFEIPELAGVFDDNYDRIYNANDK